VFVYIHIFEGFAWRIQTTASQTLPTFQ